MSLPNLWEKFNLKSSPYFQTPLQKDSDTQPLNLFVGREKEQERLLATIGSSFSSRQAVAGRPGVGKTTLVQVVKNKASEAGYWVADDFISITAESNDVLLGQLLSGVYNAVDLAGHGADVKNDPAVKEAHQLVCAIRLRNTNMSFTVAGFGAGGGSSETISNPPSALILDGPRVLRSLLNYALKNGAQGILLHLNNLENLSEADAEKAAYLLRDIRDQALMLDRLHMIIVGATDAIRIMVNRHTQIRSVFSHTMTLKQLTLLDVHELLKKRYKALQDKCDKPFQQPIEDLAVEELYKLFHGDLRGMLKSLEDGIETLLLNTMGVPSSPFTLNDLLSVLKKQNQEELEEELGSKSWSRIVTWVQKVGPDSTQTQADLLEIWEINQNAVSKIINNELIPSGAVESLPRRGQDPIKYMLTGNSRLATY